MNRFSLAIKLIISFLILIFILVGAALYFLKSVSQTGERMGTELAPHSHADSKIMLNVTIACLKLEEVLNGESSDIDGIWKHFDETKWYCESILEGGEKKQIVILPSKNPKVREKVKEILKCNEALIANAKIRIQYYQEVNSGKINENDSQKRQKRRKVDEAEENFYFYFEKFSALAHEMQVLIQKNMKQGINDLLISKTQAKWWMLVITLVGVFLAIGGATFISKEFTIPLKVAIESLTRSANQVFSISDRLSITSQTLAQGASEQAASIEETSSSLEEMASMTKSNAGHATEADQSMQEVNQIVQSTSQSMHQLKVSMSDISNASIETSKIIRTIDEIAFQTKLLALNASVEAARAGDAGRGFGVVANEIGSLAIRAAAASRNTASLIEQTLEKVQGGKQLVELTDTAFDQVASGMKKASELVNEISASCNEQASGIEEINSAVFEIDKLTQKNTSSAEESAVFSDEMMTEAKRMRESIEKLIQLVGQKKEQEEDNI